MNDIAVQNAAAYAVRHRLRLAERLGFGVHGSVYVGEDKVKKENTAIKAHMSVEPYIRERDVYERLMEVGVSDIAGFHVPQLIRFDDELRVIEMTIVTRPFVLDFAGAYLDFRPTFSEEIWADWEAKKQEQFGRGWVKVLEVISAFAELDIHLVDVSPSNIAFRN